MVKGYKPATRSRHPGFLAAALICLAIASCATVSPFERMRPIMGNWLTDQGITVAIRQSPDETFGAYIVSAPGFRGNIMEVGSAVITDIIPRPDDTFTGRFILPGDEKPVSVQMALSSRGELIIVARDRRFGAGAMTWRRVIRR